MTHVDILGQEAMAEAITSDKLTIVDFWAEWCGPCRMLAPVLHALVEKYSYGVQLVKVDVDSEPNQPLAMQYGVSSIPQVTFFRSGQKVDQFVGVQSPEAIEEMIQKHLSSGVGMLQKTPEAIMEEGAAAQTPEDQASSVGD